MTDEPTQETLPTVLPPEEAEAAIVEVEDGNRAERESAWLDDSLSVHAIEAAALKNKVVQAHIDNLDADRTMRKTYAGRILWYLHGYSVGVLILLFLAGFSVGGFSLSEEVLLTLVGSTALAAIGLVGFIARGLFQAAPQAPTDFDK